MRIKSLLFHVVLFLPLTLLILLLADIVKGIYILNNIDYREIEEELTEYLSTKEPVSFPMPVESLSNEKEISRIFLFGASSVLITNGHTFADYLENALSQNGKKVKIINFGVLGVDSFSIKKRIRDALKSSETAPRAAILYLGHNDYNSPYHNIIFPHYESFGFFLRLAYPVFRSFDYLSRIGSHFLDTERPFISLHDFYWFDRFYRPRVIKLLQACRLVRIESASYGKLNSMILNKFRKNVNEMIDILSSRGVRTIIVTPIGNLRAEPFGSIFETTDEYNLGLKTVEYDESLAHFLKARDAELFTFDVRAKSGLINWLKGTRQKNVNVLDLEGILMNRKFSFGYSHFMDYFHFNDAGHKLVARCLHDMVINEDSIKGILYGNMDASTDLDL